MHFSRTCSINKIVLVKYDTCIQALTNLVLSNIRSGTPVLQYLFVNVFPYQKICRFINLFIKQKISYTFFYKHSMFLGQRQYAYGFLTNDSRVLAAIFREWKTGLWTLQQTNMNPLCTSGS